MKCKAKTETADPHPAGFMLRNARPGVVYLCGGICNSSGVCECCGKKFLSFWPLRFFLEAHPGKPVCESCALKQGFTVTPHFLLLAQQYFAATSERRALEH